MQALKRQRDAGNARCSDHHDHAGHECRRTSVRRFTEHVGHHDRPANSGHGQGDAEHHHRPTEEELVALARRRPPARGRPHRQPHTGDECELET